MKIDREMVELLADMANDGCATPVPAPQLAELCRTWLAVQDAPVARPLELQTLGFDDPDRDRLEQLVKSGQRVRLVRDGGE